MNIRGKVVVVLMIISLLVGAAGSYVGASLMDNGLAMFNENQDKNGSVTNESGKSSPPTDQEFEKIGQAYELITSKYFKDIDKQELLEGAIQGMVGTLKDPYSVYMDQETAKQFSQSLESSFEGIGAEVRMEEGKVTIVSPFKGSPAEKSGLKPNDQIISIDGKSIEGLDLYEAVLKIRGKKGTVVKLGVRRPSVDNVLDIDVTRDTIPIETVYSSLEKHDGQNIGIIEITSFSEETAKDFKTQLADLEDKGIDGLVIDVRGNPGGYLKSVEDISKLLITDNKPILQIENRAGQKERIFSALKEKKPYPIVGLIDEGSASASEILAGALKEAGGYPLVGVKSFGKGTVQQSIEMGDGSNIKLTTFKWLTPDGNWINEKGIKPTHEVKQPEYFYTNPISLEKALEYDMNGDQIKNAQIMLRGLGFEPGRTDGYFGRKTETAVKAFQNSNELGATGVLDKKTAGVLETKIIEAIQSKDHDLQLKTALELAVEKISSRN
jgi:carboxyl-terminal processing protease